MQNLSELTNDQLMNMARYHFGSSDTKMVEAIDREIMKRLEVYDKYTKSTKAQQNIQDLVNNQEDCPPEFNEIFQKNMWRILA